MNIFRDWVLVLIELNPRKIKVFYLSDKKNQNVKKYHEDQIWQKKKGIENNYHNYPKRYSQNLKSNLEKQSMPTNNSSNYMLFKDKSIPKSSNSDLKYSFDSSYNGKKILKTYASKIIPNHIDDKKKRKKKHFRKVFFQENKSSFYNGVDFNLWKMNFINRLKNLTK